MTWLVLAVLALLPWAGYAAALRLTGGRIGVAIATAAAVGAALGAFLASAGSAMATSVDPDAAMLRGAGYGLAGGALVGALAAAMRLVRRGAAKETT